MASSLIERGSAAVALRISSADDILCAFAFGVRGSTPSSSESNGDGRVARIELVGRSVKRS